MFESTPSGNNFKSVQFWSRNLRAFFYFYLPSHRGVFPSRRTFRNVPSLSCPFESEVCRLSSRSNTHTHTHTHMQGSGPCNWCFFRHRLRHCQGSVARFYGATELFLTHAYTKLHAVTGRIWIPCHRRSAACGSIPSNPYDLNTHTYLLLQYTYTYAMGKFS